MPVKARLTGRHSYPLPLLTLRGVQEEGAIPEAVLAAPSPLSPFPSLQYVPGSPSSAANLPC